MRRCDSAAIVPNTRELLPEPETPVNTVSRRLGSSTLTSLRLLTRAPCTRVRSWLSARCSAGDGVSVLVAVLIVSLSGEVGAAFAVCRGSDQPVSVAHQFAVGQLVHLTPRLDAAGGGAKPRVRSGQRTRVEAGVRDEPVAPLPRQRADLDDIDVTLDHGHVAGATQPQPNGPGGGQVSAGRAVRRVWPSAAPRRPSRRTAAPDTAHRPPRRWPPRHRCRW